MNITDDELQLEQTGRVFGALSSNPKSHPTAQLTKLRHTLPVASNIFHDALDQLETELVGDERSVTSEQLANRRCSTLPKP